MDTQSARRVVVMVGTKKGLVTYTSDPDRKRWDVRGPFLSGWSVDCVHADRQEGTIFVGTSHRAYASTVRVTSDHGESWTQLSPGPSFSAARGYKLRGIWEIKAGALEEPETLYAGVDEAALFVSRDHGATWRELTALTDRPSRREWKPGGAGLSVHSILVHPANAKRIWVAIAAVGVFRTDDGGESWRPCHRGLSTYSDDKSTESPPEFGYTVTKMAHSPKDPDVLYLQSHHGVFRSADGGDTWTPAMAGLPSRFGFPIAVSRSGDVYTVPLESPGERYMKDGRCTVYRLRSGEDEWQPCRRGLPDDPYYVSVLRNALTTDSLDPAGVYFGTSSGEIFYSRDAGDTWAILPGKYDGVLSIHAAVY